MESKDNQKETLEERQAGAQKRPAAEKKEPAPGGDRMVQVRESEYQELRRSAADYKDKYIRLYAEFENARKRLERDKLEFVKYANEGLITEFLNVLDDLERSVDAAGTRHQDYDSFLKGVEMIMAHLYEMLKRHGLRPIEAVGKKFDPHCHEVLMQEETHDEHKDGTVVEEFQRGYYLGDRVIRTAKVKVAVKPRSQESPEPAAGAEPAADKSGQTGEEDHKKNNGVS